MLVKKNGRELKHEYAIRAFLGAYQLTNKNDFIKKIILKSERKNRNAGAVIFVQESHISETLQSLE